MDRLLDILEQFLNFHGHIYLRLDGTTRVDQRQVSHITVQWQGRLRYSAGNYRAGVVRWPCPVTTGGTELTGVVRGRVADGATVPVLGADWPRRLPTHRQYTRSAAASSLR